MPRPALELAQPVLRFVPSTAELVLVAPDLDKLLFTARAMEPFAQQVPVAKEWLDLLAANLGALTSKETWNRFGIDQGAALALFSEGTSTTLLLAVMAESQAWSGLAEAVLANQSHLLADETGGVLALRWSVDGISGAADDAAGWVEAMQSAALGDSYAAGEQAARAAEFAKQFTASVGDEVWGSLDLAALLGHTALPCTNLASGIRGVSLSAKALANEGELHLQVLLQDTAVTTLRGLLGPSATSGMSQLREQEGLSASMRLDLALTARALAARDCQAIADIIEFNLNNLGFAPTAAHFAGSRFDPSEFSGQLALHLGLRDKRFFSSLLGQIPGRSLFESKLNMAGQRVVKVSVPLMSTLYYQLSDERLFFATPKGMMGALLTEPSDGQELFFLNVVPERLPQLGQLLALAMPRAEAQILSVFLRQFAWLRASLSLKDTRLLIDVLVRVQGG